MSRNTLIMNITKSSLSVERATEHSTLNKQKPIMRKLNTRLLSLLCNVRYAKKNFGSEVNLKSHLKYVHSEERKESCPHCDASFKQKKNLRAHLANIHDIDQMTEKYCETYKKSLFKCKECDVEFMYEKNLKAHMKTKDGDKAIVHKCELCPSKYSNKRTLVAHVKMKHK